MEMHTRTGSTLTPSGMVVAKTEPQFIAKLEEGMANWTNYCLEYAPTHEQQLAFLNGPHRHVIIHPGTHGQISVELFNPDTDLAIPNPTRTLDTRNGTDGAIVYTDGPARFERFELPPRVEHFRLHEGAIAPGVCFSDEEVSFKNLMTALTRKNIDEMVKNIDPAPENWSKSDDYEINLSNELMPHADGFFKHHWKQRHYKQVPQPEQGDRSKYPIVKRFVTTINELKKADIRLFEWHVVAFMMFKGKFFFIDLNPYLFPEEIKRAHLRSGVEKPRHDQQKSDVVRRDDINDLLHAVTNTAKLVSLFSNTTNITCIDSTCSVLRFKVRDGRGINGALSNIRDGSYDGVIDSCDIRRKKLILKDMLESDDRSRVKTRYRDIKTLTEYIRRWYDKKGIVVPVPEQLVVNKDSDPSALTIIRLLLTNINYESIWIRPIEYGKAMEYLMSEIEQYMREIITDPNEHKRLIDWLNTYMISRVRTLTVGPIDRYGFPLPGSPATDPGSPKSPLVPSLEDPTNASPFTKLRTTKPQFFRSRAANPYGGGKVKRSNKKQHKKYKNTRKGRRRTNKNKKKRTNKTNKK